MQMAGSPLTLLIDFCVLVLTFHGLCVGSEAALSCGTQSWGSEKGLPGSPKTYGTLQIFRKQSSEKYINATACGCAGWCRATDGCIRWVLRAQYKGYATFFVQKCRDERSQPFECGFNASCYLKSTPRDVYSGERSLDTTEGVYPIVSGVIRCPSPYSVCRGSSCCDTSSHVCHPDLGCIPRTSIHLSGDPFQGVVFYLPLFLALAFVVIGIVVEAAYWITLKLARTTPSHVHQRLTRRYWFVGVMLCFDLAALVMVYTEFVIGYSFLAKFDVNDYGYTKVNLLNEMAISAQSTTRYPGDYAVKLQHLMGRSIPVVFTHLGRYYVVTHEIFNVPWYATFQYILLGILPLQMIIYFVTMLWKLFVEFHNLRDASAKPATFPVNLLSDLTQPLMVNFIMEPLSRAWNMDFFETWGMTAQYMCLEVAYFLAQLLFCGIALVLYRYHNVALFTFDRFSPENMGRVLWVFCCIYIICEAVMGMLSFIYRGTVPPGPVHWRVFYYYVVIVAIMFVKYTLRGISLHLKYRTRLQLAASAASKKRRSTVGSGSNMI